MYLVLGLDQAVYADPWFWLPVATLIYIFQLITAFIQTGLFKLHKRDFKSTSKASDRGTENSHTSHRASTHGGMHMSAVATKGESVNDTLSEEQLLSGEDTKRTATTAESVDARKISNEESPREDDNINTAVSELEESSSSSQSEQEEKSSSADKDESNSGSGSESSESESN
jgi:hypothetical protein